MRIVVINWFKHNPRTSAAAKKNSTWFKVEDRYLLGAEHFGKHTLESIGTFFYLLSLCSEASSDTLDINFTHVRNCLGVSRTSFLRGCQTLREQGVIKFDQEQQSPPTYIHTYIQRETASLEYDVGLYPLEKLELLYDAYPRKEGKKRGMQVLRKIVRTDADLERIRLAIENYKAKLRKDKTDSKYIKHFATFVNNWEDYDTKANPVYHPQDPVGGHAGAEGPKPRPKEKSFFEIAGEAHNPDAIYDDKGLLE